MTEAGGGALSGSEEPARSRVSDPPRIREALASDRLAIAGVIGRAFFDDPVAVHLFPDETRRRAGFGAFARLAMDQFAGAGATFVTDPVQGAAIWQAPSPAPLPFLRQVSMAFRLLLTARSGFSRAVRLSEAIEAKQYGGPHWYLAILGIDPELQGRGYGTALLQPILGRCDQQGSVATLESSKESNIPFYARHGFEVSGEVAIPDGPRIWTMIRQPS